MKRNKMPGAVIWILAVCAMQASIAATASGPSIETVEPARGFVDEDTEVTLTGREFAADASVSFGGGRSLYYGDRIDA